MIIAVDFDGVLNATAYPNVGEAIPGAIEGMQKLHSLGPVSYTHLTMVECQPCLLYISTHQCFATSKDHQEFVRINVRGKSVNHPEKLLHSQLLHPTLYPTIATTMGTMKVAPQGTLPKESGHLMLSDRFVSKYPMGIESEFLLQSRLKRGLFLWKEKRHHLSFFFFG